MISKQARRQFAVQLICSQLQPEPDLRDDGWSAGSGFACLDDEDDRNRHDEQQREGGWLGESPVLATRDMLSSRTPSPRRARPGYSGRPSSLWNSDEWDLSSDEYLELLLAIEAQLNEEVGRRDPGFDHSAHEHVYYENLLLEEERERQELADQLAALEHEGVSRVLCPLCQVSFLSWDPISCQVACGSGRSCEFSLPASDASFLSSLDAALHNSVLEHDDRGCYEPLGYSLAFSFHNMKKTTMLWAKCRTCLFNRNAFR